MNTQALQALRQYRDDLKFPVTDPDSIVRRLAMIDEAINAASAIDEGSFCPACRDNQAHQLACPFCNQDDEISRDIKARNAGPETLTVWVDGAWKRWGYRDAEIAAACEPDKVLLNVRLSEMTPALEASSRQEERLREALEPFSRAMGNCADDTVNWPDSDTIEFSGADEHITWGDLRRARAALEPPHSAKDQK